MFLSLTQQFATQQNHDVQVKDLLFSLKGMLLTQVQSLRNSGIGEVCFSLHLSSHPTGDLAYKEENRQSIVVTLVSATITFQTHTG